jgi:hypothetical protein
LSATNTDHQAVTAEAPVFGHRSSPDVVVEVSECEVVPGEKARFPFTVRNGARSPSIHEFNVVSDNSNFDLRWVHIVQVTGVSGSAHYALEIQPADVRRGQYGTYPLRIYWQPPDGSPHVAGRCTLTIKPCLRLKGKPTFKTWPGGELSLSLENCGGASLDVSVSVSHHGSSWSQGWEFELETQDGPFEFTETFEPPQDGRGGEFNLSISAAGVPLIQMPLRANRFAVSRKHVATAAIVLVGAAIGIIWTTVLSGPALTAQAISFTSQASSPAVGSTYTATATGGGSGNPVTFTIDSASTPVCSISGATVTFNQPGTCVVDANQAGNAHYQAAAQAQQNITVPGRVLAAQAISFTSQAPSPAVGSTYTATATGGGSGNPVTFTIDPASTPVCSISGASVTFDQPGTCVIDANQAGNAHYQAAAQAQQDITVSGSPGTTQAIVFTSKPSSTTVGSTYTVTARGGGSGNPVTFTIDPASTSACSISGATVTFNQAGTCVIDANQAGNAHYQAAAQRQQDIAVTTTQTISFTSTAAANSAAGDTYDVTATGGASGNPVTFTIDPASTSICSISGATVTFNQAGICVIDANQAGNAQYQQARQVQQDVAVGSLRVP